MHSTQYGVHGTASSRFSGIGFPQWVHRPYVPSSIRESDWSICWSSTRSPSESEKRNSLVYDDEALSAMSCVISSAFSWPASLFLSISCEISSFCSTSARRYFSDSFFVTLTALAELDIRFLLR